jgi:hypothetical protein
LPPPKRNLVWSIGAGLVLTRVVLLAHWTSDVIAGLAIGAAVERLLRPWTGFGSPVRTAKSDASPRSRCAAGPVPQGHGHRHARKP